MFSSQIVVELPEFFDSVPFPAWVAGGVVVWYFLIGFAMRFLERDDYGFVYIPFTTVDLPSFLLWLFHPLILVIVIAVYVLGTVAWAISCGTVPPPWKWCD